MRSGIKVALAILLFVAASPVWPAPTFVQGNSNVSSPFTTSNATSIAVAFPSNVTAGSVIAVAVSYDNGGNPTTLNSVTDNRGNTYTIVRTIFNSTPNQRTSVAYAKNVNAGATTVTANFSASVCCRAIIVHEISGVDTAAPLDGNSGQGQASPGTAANAVTSTNMTTTTNGDYIFGITINDDLAAGEVITPGTGETQRFYIPVASGNPMMTADKIQTTAGAIASTFTFSKNGSAATMQMAFKPAALANFLVSVSGTASTCTPSVVTITARNSSNATLTGYTGTITLSTSTGNGDWSINTASGTLTPGAADSGSATYTFVAADNGDIVLNLTDQHAENLTITVSDASAAVSTTSSTVQFRDNALVVTATDALGNIPVAGRLHAMNVAMWRKDPTTGNCSVATNYTGVHNLKAWRTLDASNPAGATAPNLTNAAGTTTLLTGVPTAVPGANNLTLTFTSGQAAFGLATSDVGKFVLNMRDDSGTFAGVTVIDGASPTLTVRPFGFYVTIPATPAPANTGATTPTGAIFRAAGNNFSATVTAVAWAAADDANNDGIPDAGSNLSTNTVLTRYAWATTLAADSTGFQPSTGTVGVVNNGSIAAGSFASGSATPATLQYTEVGSFTLRASATGYLGTAGANITDSGGVVVGRFTPFDFAVSLNTPQFAAGCVSGAFTYIGQPFIYATAPVITVTARNAQAGTTRNYTGTWWKLTNSTVTPVAQSSRYTAFTGTLDITGLPATTADPTIVDSGNGTGTLTFDAGTGLAFTRSTRVAPFNADIALSLTIIDGDSIVYASNPARFGTATSGNGIAFSGAKEMRFGRLWLGNAIGSELIDLPIPLSVQYWNGFAFVTNSSDSCTTLPATAPNTPLALSNFQGALSACETAVSPTTTLTFASGQGSLKLIKPGRGNTGSVDMTMNLGTASGTTCITAGGSTVTAGTAGRTWLQGNWGGSATYTVNPTARATFGPYHSSQEFIYQRENY